MNFQVVEQGIEQGMKPIKLVKLIRITDYKKNAPTLIITAGFSDEAYQKCKQIAEEFTHLFNIYVVYYDKTVSDRQKEICEEYKNIIVLKANKEQALAYELAWYISKRCKEMNIKKPHVLAKSAGGAVAINLAQIMILQSLHLFAPAPVIFRKNKILGSPVITLGWNNEDPRIPMKPNMVWMETIFEHMLKLKISKKIYHGKSHDFNLKFVHDVLNQALELD
jgi:hypothetical protein